MNKDLEQLENGAVSDKTSNLENRNWNNAGSSPVSVKVYKCKYCFKEFQNVGIYRNHLRWQHIKPDTKSNDGHFNKSEKWLTAMASLKGKKQNHPKVFCKCPFCGEEKEWVLSRFTMHKNHCKLNPNRKNYKGHSISDSLKKQISEKQRNNSYRRIMRHTQEYPGVLYDSSWEIEMAKRLEFLNEQFERPKNPIKYIGVDGKQHNYFPDFWIPRIQKFIEVKNPYLFENDSKVQILKSERSDIIWLTSLEQIQNFGAVAQLD